MNVHKSIYFCQWNIANESNHLQYKTGDLLKVLKELESYFKEPVLSVNTFESGVLQVNFDYVSVFVSTGMDELIDCEVLP